MVRQRDVHFTINNILTCTGDSIYQYVHHFEHNAEDHATISPGIFVFLQCLYYMHHLLYQMVSFSSWVTLGFQIGIRQSWKTKELVSTRYNDQMWYFTWAFNKKNKKKRDALTESIAINLFFNIWFIIQYYIESVREKNFSQPCITTLISCACMHLLYWYYCDARNITLHFSDVRRCCLWYKLSSHFFHSLHIRQRKCFFCLSCKIGWLKVTLV